MPHASPLSVGPSARERDPDPDPATACSAAVVVGQRIKWTRQRAGLSLREVSDRSGLSKGYLSQVEGGRCNPTLNTLVRIAAVLGATDATFSWPSSSRRSGAFATRSPVFPVLGLPPEVGRSRRLTGQDGGAFTVRQCEGTPAHHAGMRRHAGEEFCHVLSGVLRAEVDGRRHLLRGGESLHFDADCRHRLTALQAGTTFLLVG
ncbi:helix-turn-helix domain-containing protein [Streptomyces sp. cmx-4-9]|uniref:helix-turn-helix domain-containing protein n=1 Tax=Streptomyces sp. cmx-4-9 TaxID=2790941 RepID=UPI0039807CE4